MLDIDPQLLQKHFDECITTYVEEECTHKKQKKSKQKCSQHCSYSIDLTSILPPKEAEKQDQGDNEYLAEMPVLEDMSSDSEYDSLILHPLVLVFIAMKWHQIRYFFFLDLIAYLSFTVCLNLYIFYPIVLFYLFVCVLLAVIIIWEVIQITVFCKLYLRFLESWLKMSVILLGVVIILMHYFKAQAQYALVQIYAVASLISFINFFFVIGNFPTFSTSVIMIKSVYLTLFKSFLTYSILIIAFINSFYIVFRDYNYDFFRNYWLAIFKTIVMSTGEYDSGNLTEEVYTIAYPILILFVLLISIGLLNLLTGLAVSDIQNIKSNAEMYGYEMRILQISRMEKIFLRYIFFRRFSCFRSICLFANPDLDMTVDIDANNRTIEITNIAEDQVLIKMPVSDKILNVLKARRKFFQEDDS